MPETPYVEPPIEFGEAFANAPNTTPTSASKRYLDPIFSEWIETVEMEYQSHYKYKVFMPTPDTQTKRRVIILYTGGGTLELGGLTGKAVELVKLGYVVVPAQYKQTIGNFTLQEQKEAVINTYILMQFLCKEENATKFGIKKNAIFGAGQSAGGFTMAQAAVTANDTTNPFYEGYKVPATKDRLKAVASISGAVNPQYMGLIQPSTVQTNFYNGGKDQYTPSAQEAATREIELGIKTFIKIYPESGHDDIDGNDVWNNPEYGIIPTFYNRMKTETP